MSGRESIGGSRQSEADEGGNLIRLKDFLPYRLVVLADLISRSLSELYEDRFGLSRQEWRVLAALADNGPTTSVDVSRYTTLDPMAISRASSALEDKGYIVREESPTDRRAKVFRSTRSGRALYRKIMPLAIDRERYLTESLSADERAILETIVDRLLNQASKLAELKTTTATSDTRKRREEKE